MTTDPIRCVDNRPEDRRLQLAASLTGQAERLAFLREHGMGLFATPDIADTWTCIRDWPIGEAPELMPLLIKLWAAFLSGDAAAVSGLRRHLADRTPGTAREASTLQAFEALGSGGRPLTERIQQAEHAVAVLEGTAPCPEMANAILTLAQLLAGGEAYRRSCTLFQEAARMFAQCDMPFPAAVSTTNALLGQWRLGLHEDVLRLGALALSDSASFGGTACSWWEIVRLPMGLSCLETGRTALAGQHLEAARLCIRSLRLFHMHGLVELGLFRVHLVRNDLDGMTRLLEESQTLFGSMHHAGFDRLLAMMRSLTADAGGRAPGEADRECFGPETMAVPGDGMGIGAEMRCWLMLHGYVDDDGTPDVVPLLEHVRRIGHRPALQLFLLLAADLGLKSGHVGQAEVLVAEAIDLWRETGGYAGFLMHPARAVHLVRVMEPGLYRLLSRMMGNRMLAVASTNASGHMSPAPSANGQGAADPALRSDGGSARRSERPSETLERLSAREREILALAAAGHGNQEIGATLFLGTSTVKWHINRIFAKLGATSRIQAIQIARERGDLP